MTTASADVRAVTMKISLGLVSALAVAQTGGEVVVPLEQWLEIERKIATLEADSPPPVAMGVRDRRLTGTFDRGVLRGKLELEVETFAAATSVPLLDRDASLAEVLVDGKRAVAVRTGAHYAVFVEKPGVHRVSVSFVHGREQARFARMFSIALPVAPVSRLAVTLPEKELDVEVEGGVVMGVADDRVGTKVDAAFEGRDRLTVRWRRRATHDDKRAREMEVEGLALVRMEPDLVLTQSLLTYTLVAGETDRVEATIPAGVEVTRVTGDAILQWYTEGDDGAHRLVVLLKHLVSDRARIVVHAQAPFQETAQADVGIVTPAGAALGDTWIAVEGRAGFDLTVKALTGGEAVRPREVPAALSSLTDKPLLFAYRGRGRWPAISLLRAKNTEIALTQAVIDDLQASTVLVAQGLEVTKLRLYIRNNTRQYLSMVLPEGAKVTHAMIDGAAFLPAVTKVGGEERLLVPLRQSERIAGGRRQHVVRDGDTLGGISLRYFGRTDRWDAILDANYGLGGPEDLVVGQAIDIPQNADGVTFEESNFVVEIAYKVEKAKLGMAGAHQTRLPALDIPVMSSTWHYYFPNAFEPLRFASNFSQLSSIRYDPLRRLRYFWRNARFIEHAWAGSAAGYENILQFRKAIYAKEQRQQVTEALAAFPLVGQRYRFERVLLDRERAYVDLVYVDKSLLPLARAFMFLLALVVAFRFARLVQREGRLFSAVLSGTALTFAATVAMAAVVGHFVLGVHRHALLGVDAGLALVVLPPLVRRWFTVGSEAIRTRTIRVESWWRPRTIVRIAVGALVVTLLLAYPLLLSSACLVGLVVLTALSRKEASRV